MKASSSAVSDSVRARPHLAHVVIEDDTGLLRRLVEHIGHGRRKGPRWAHVLDALGHGSGVSAAICLALDLDPDEIVGDRR